MTTRILLAAGAALASGAAAQTCIDGLCFVDRAQSGEIDVGSLRGGPAVLDFDGDGWLDLYIAGYSGGPHRLYRNVEDGMRPGARTFEDVTAGSGLDQPDGQSRVGRGAVVADYDNDGDQDLYVLGERSGDFSAGLLYRNEGGGQFTNVSVESGVRTNGQIPASALWLDFDLDGDADLLVSYDAGSSRSFDLFRNDGAGGFAPANELLPAIAIPNRNYSMTATDFDLDGWSDVVTLTTGIGPNLLQNVPDGAGGRRFAEVAQSVGYTVLGPAPMGISAGDFDNDGDFDLSITDAATGTYYENLGGVLQKFAPVESIFGWGVSWLDADNDARLDMFQAGSYSRGPAHNKLFRNTGAGFEDVSVALNDALQDSKNAVRTDFNNDGRPDLVVANPGGNDLRTSVMENTSTTPGAWLTIDLVGDARLVNTDAIGAIVRVHAGGVTQHREVVSGSSTCSTEDLRAHFGLGAAQQADWVEVVWPRRGSLASRTDRFAGPISTRQILTLSPRCLADYDADGSPDTRDVLAFLNDWARGDSRADLNGDGSVNTQDVLAFLNEWALGCE